ncbi:MAG: hypothetical protein ACOC2E_02700 [Bacteroidota bacterium]
MEARAKQTDQSSQTDPHPYSEKNCCELVNISVIISESSSLAVRLLKVKTDHLLINQGLFLSNTCKNSPTSPLYRLSDFLSPPSLPQKSVRFIYFSDQSPPQKNNTARA